jgi:hypothetical protein
MSEMKVTYKDHGPKSGSGKSSGAGKGDTARPLSVSREQYNKNYDLIDWSDSRPPAES